MDAASQKKHQNALAQHRLINPPSRRRGIKPSMHVSASSSAPGSEGKGGGDGPTSRAHTSDPLHSGAGATLGLRNPRRRTAASADDNVDALVQEGLAAPASGSGRRALWPHDRLKQDELDGTRTRGLGSAHTHMLPPAGPPSRQGGRVRPNSASIMGSGRSHIMGLTLAEKGDGAGGMAAAGGFVRTPSGPDGVLRSSPMQTMMGVLMPNKDGATAAAVLAVMLPE